MITFGSIKAPCDRVALIGMMGTGKSKFGRLVANNLGFNFYDVDTLIEKKFKITIKELFQRHGETFFRDVEKKTIKELVFKIKENNEKVIISVGGGGFDNIDSRELLLNYTKVIWLKTPVNILTKRVGNGSKRPMIKGDVTEAIKNLLKKRTEFYSLCHYKLDTHQLSQNQITEKIINLISLKSNKIKNEIRNY